MQQERRLSSRSNIFTSWSYCTNVAKLDMRIFEIKCYFRNLIGQFISFMVCSRNRQDYIIVQTISISIQNRDYDRSEFTPESIVSAGQKALVYRPMYKGKLTDNLDSLRYTMFCQKVTSSKLYIKPEVLPPTSAAARYHCLWLFYKVRQWMGKNIKAHEWGWTISCNCKTNCLTLRCTCRKY